MKRGKGIRSTWYELLSSMRFAIATLSVLAIASVLGTVLQQNRPYLSYIDEFGPFWFDVFRVLGLFDVYHAAWFLLILCFLVTSTSLCIVRHAPGMIREWRSYREHASLGSLSHFHHQQRWALDAPLDATTLTDWLKTQGYRWRSRPLESGGLLLAAKRGAASRLGYLAAHGAIVLICVGGLLDGNVPLKLAEVFGLKRPDASTPYLDQFPAASRLSADNWSFRAYLTVPEGGTRDLARLPSGDGLYAQELPFRAKLLDFRVEHYSSGQPKLFASEVELTDKRTGQTSRHTIEVNKPAIINGIALYQSDFEDGGSRLQVKPWLIKGWQAGPSLSVNSRETYAQQAGDQTFRLEFQEFRLFNIENLGGPDASSDFTTKLQSARQVTKAKNLKNVGPSMRFKLRDAAGQAREYHNYMQPITLDGSRYYVSGTRSDPAADLAYVRIPVGPNGDMGDFRRLSTALFDPTRRDAILKRVAATLDPALGEVLRGKAMEEVPQIVDTFGAIGFQGMEKAIQTRADAKTRDIIARGQLVMLQTTAWEAWVLANQQAGLPMPQVTPENQRFVLDSLLALSQLHEYGTPLWLELEQFEQVQATVLQVARAPGAYLVYLGCLLLMIGIYLMFYVRERRLWLWLEPGQLLLAMSSNRSNHEFEEAFVSHRNALDALVRRNP